MPKLPSIGTLTSTRGPGGKRNPSLSAFRALLPAVVRSGASWREAPAPNELRDALSVALLYSEVAGGITYEVRSAGHTRRLYTNGVLHTQYNPGRLWGNGIWDALAYPAMLAELANPRILMLGLGGGAVLHVLHKLLSPRQLVAVEIDPVHVDIARHWFDVDNTGVKIHEADAFAWARSCRSRFDIVIDDVFLHRPGADPYRPVVSEPAWRVQAEALLRPHGVLIRNHIDPAPARMDAVAATGNAATVIECRMPHYCNVVTAAFHRTVHLRSARSRLRGPKGLNCRVITG